jgi:hypothetical protein
MTDKLQSTKKQEHSLSTECFNIFAGLSANNVASLRQETPNKQ